MSGADRCDPCVEPAGEINAGGWAPGRVPKAESRNHAPKSKRPLRAGGAARRPSLSAAGLPKRPTCYNAAVGGNGKI